MSGTICTCEWGINVFHSSVYTRRERDILWKLYKRERDGMRGRGNNISGNDGDRILRICVTIWDDVIMRGDGYNKLSVSDTIHRG